MTTATFATLLYAITFETLSPNDNFSPKNEKVTIMFDKLQITTKHLHIV
jgi:hypothetical protein